MLQKMHVFFVTENFTPKSSPPFSNTLAVTVSVFAFIERRWPTLIMPNCTIAYVRVHQINTADARINRWAQIKLHWPPAVSVTCKHTATICEWSNWLWWTLGCVELLNDASRIQILCICICYCENHIYVEHVCVRIFSMECCVCLYFMVKRD